MKKLDTLPGWVCLTGLLLFAWAGRQAAGATIVVDGSQTNQLIDGFGVNANYWSWTNNDLKPVLDGLIDNAGMTLFRVVFNNGWEETNDNGDPNVLNQGYYDALYAGPEFEKLWGMMAYLNQKGITNGLVLNFQGPGPSWMGGGTLTVGMEDEWSEMIVSLLLYARTNRHLQFNLVAPDNEPNITGEGIHVPTASQYVTMLHKLAQKLDAYGLADFRMVVPDRADGSTDFFPEIMNDPVIMVKVAHFGMHSYSEGGGDTATVYSLVDQSSFRDRKLWLTEFNVWCEMCERGGQGTNDWNYFRETADYLLDHLNGGASGALVWEGYDSFYPHHAGWSFWGLFAVDDTGAVLKTYTPRKNFYALSQISKFVRPGSRRIELSGSLGALKAVAFYNDNLGQVTLTGMNATNTAVELSGTLVSLPALGSLDLYHTDSVTNLARDSTVQVNDDAFTVTIPGDCIFTLTGFASSSVSTNLAFTAAGFTWHSLSTPTANSPSAAAPGINDGDLSTDVPLLPGGALDSANAYEAAGLIWAAPQTIRRVVYRNGSWTSDENGVFAADFQLELSADGTNWMAAGPEWSASPDYAYNSPLAANTRFTFQGGTNAVRGVRCAGRVHTSEAPSPSNSWVAFATEVQAFDVPAITRPVLRAITVSNSVVISWPVAPETYVLEAAGDVNQAGGWSLVTNLPQQVAQENRVTLAPTGAQRFFRLRQQ